MHPKLYIKYLWLNAFFHIRDGPDRESAGQKICGRSIFLRQSIMEKTMVKKTVKKAARRSVIFKLEDAPGRQVFVAGCFSNWEPKFKLVDRDGVGVYTARILLEPGDYQYKFVVDGEWRLDSANPNFVPNSFGTLNSLLKVSRNN